MIDAHLEPDAMCKCGEWITLTDGGSGECYECTFGEREEGKREELEDAPVVTRSLRRRPRCEDDTI
tara:strand:+ start:513 stop:710 length:198 start_codon:yes stop_codon:yes gene_type:complete